MAATKARPHKEDVRAGGIPKLLQIQVITEKLAFASNRHSVIETLQTYYSHTKSTTSVERLTSKYRKVD